jgi:hypothetical protein
LEGAAIAWEKNNSSPEYHSEQQDKNLPGVPGGFFRVWPQALHALKGWKSKHVAVIDRYF